MNTLVYVTQALLWASFLTTVALGVVSTVWVFSLRKESAVTQTARASALLEVRASMSGVLDADADVLDAPGAVRRAELRQLGIRSVVYPGRVVSDLIPGFRKLWDLPGVVEPRARPGAHPGIRKMVDYLGDEDDGVYLVGYDSLDGTVSSFIATPVDATSAPMPFEVLLPASLDAEFHRDLPVLTEQERRVLTLLASGQKVQSIATELGLARSTVYTYIRRIGYKYSSSGFDVPTGTEPRGRTKRGGNFSRERNYRDLF